MRSIVFIVCALCACATPNFVECPPQSAACADGCFDLTSSNDHCGACDVACASGMTCITGECTGSVPMGCAVDNGGCSVDAMCFDDPNGPGVMCLCRPGFTGTGTSCAACSVCAIDAFEIAMCTPFEDRMCAPCSPSCASCFGASDQCTSCPLGSVLVGQSCIPMMSTCHDGFVDPNEMCDDGNAANGDGCSATCQIEAGFYCFGNGTSRCRAGSCAFDPAIALPLGPAFAIDGVGMTSPFGVTLTQRSTIRTTADLQYPIMIEADVMYSGPDTTFIGARGDGLRVPADQDEPTATLRARLSSTTIEMAAGPQIVESMPAPFAFVVGAPYRIRYEDDGVSAVVTWIDLSAPVNQGGIATLRTFHGTADRAFIGGGDMGAVTIGNIRACSAPPLPVTAGLVGRYSAIESWTVEQNPAHEAFTWNDTSGNNNHLFASGGNPIFSPGLMHGLAALDFTGGSRMTTGPFMLTTDVTVFAVFVQRTPVQFGAIAHHGDRDDDWSLEQSGAPNPNTLHLQTNNDNANVELTLVQDTGYVVAGRFAGNARYFSASTFDGAPPMVTSIVDASHTITVGDKAMNVGTSSIGEASNAFIAELLYFSRALDDLERDQVIDYLRRLWR